ncbi:hypothetical protein PanWU01x14_318620 [Parasponia andersonii]|uniref:Uncharacterized protein n=1 Tax=Parasponia andersonii TaxID=3476 RepID=A0A2P5AM47_PARAD|nr:hypothetical protein PanWU01x14_318620 [Parasponia andersonii]
MGPAYKVWVFHGEDPLTHLPLENDNEDMANTYRMYRDVYFDDGNDMNVDNTSERKEEEFRSTLKDVEVPLYPGCMKYTKISALVVLYKHKAMHNLSDIGFEELLKLINDMLPPNSTLAKRCIWRSLST